MNLIFSKQVSVNIFYKFYLKNSRKFLTNTHYYFKKLSLQRRQNTPLMFVRAPKHFKSGKQIIVFFNSVFVYRKLLNLKHRTSWVQYLNNQVLFNLIKSLHQQKFKNDVIISRITLKTTLFLTINGGYTFFTNNN